MKKYRFWIVLGLLVLCLSGCQQSSDTSDHALQSLKAYVAELEAQLLEFEEAFPEFSYAEDTPDTKRETAHAGQYDKEQMEITRLVLESGNNFNHLIVEDVTVSPAKDGIGYDVVAKASYEPISTESDFLKDREDLNESLLIMLEGLPTDPVQTFHIDYHDDHHDEIASYHFERVDGQLVPVTASAHE